MLLYQFSEHLFSNKTSMKEWHLSQTCFYKEHSIVKSIIASNKNGWNTGPSSLQSKEYISMKLLSQDGMKKSYNLWEGGEKSHLMACQPI